MGVYDRGATLTVSAPATGDHLTFSADGAGAGVIDLNPGAGAPGTNEGERHRGLNWADPDAGGPLGAVDLRGSAPQPGSGNPLYAEFTVTTAFAISGGTPACNFAVVLSETVDPATDGAVVLCQSGGVTTAYGALVQTAVQPLTLIADTRVVLVLPQFSDLIQSTFGGQRLRYLSACIVNQNYHVAGTFFSAGAARMRVTADAPHWGDVPGGRTYPAGYEVN